MVGYFRIVEQSDDYILIDSEGLEDPKANVVRFSCTPVVLSPDGFALYRLCVIEFDDRTDSFVGNYLMNIEANKSGPWFLTKDDIKWNSIKNSIATQKPNG